MIKKMSKISCRKLCRKLQGGLAIFLVLVLVCSSLPVVQASALEVDTATNASYAVTITEEQLLALEEMREFNDLIGLVGFEDEFALPDDDSQVAVIIFFANNPASTQVIEAALEGYILPLAAAQQIVEDDHYIFRRELANMFAAAPRARGGADAYHITTEYRHALNGVAMTLPANLVAEVANIGVVRAIMPDLPLAPPEPLIENDGEFAEFAAALLGSSATPFAAGTNPWGMLQGRSRMNADQLHQQGVDGSGIIVAVIDTGIDWMHPAFTGSFASAEVINAARIARFGPAGSAGHYPELAAPLSQAELFNINRYETGPFGTVGFPRAGEEPQYVFLGRDNMRLWPGGQGDDPRGNPIQPGGNPLNWAYPQLLPPGMPGNNPSECSPLYFVNEAGVNMRTQLNLVEAGPSANIPGWSSHGTHVAGTILGRPYPAIDSPDFNPAQAIMGVAPGAYGIHYRGLYGHGATYASIWISAQEWAFLDGATVVNLSLGQQVASAVNLINHSINQIMLADPTIVFTVSAGNNGASGFFTGSNPGGGSVALTVSMLAEPMPGITITSDSLPQTGGLVFMTPNVGAPSVVYNPVYGYVLEHPSLKHDAGEYKVFAMPLTPGSPAGDQNALADVPVGAGTVADFAALYELYGADLAGHIVLVRRGEPFADIAARAIDLGLGGIIQINTPHQTVPSFSTNALLMFAMRYESGAALARSLDGGYGYFRVSGRDYFSVVHGMPTVAAGSSRGPTELSYEISPCIGAHGVTVFSAIPRATVGGMGAIPWQDRPWQSAYGNMSGTSMSSPHLAGAVALLQHYSRENAGGIWPNYEIRTRIMNTAIQLDYADNIYSPFDGARNVDVLAATQTNTVVYAEFTRVATDLFVDFNSPWQNFETTLTGAFSFGGFNRNPAMLGQGPRNIGNGAASYTIIAYVENNTNAPITYSLSHSFNPAGLRPARPAGSHNTPLDGAMLSHPSILTVPANSRLPFAATINLPANDELGFYEGFMTISGGSHDIVLPFAAVTYDRQPAFQFLGLYRPVITTNTDTAHNLTSHELVMFFEQNWGFYADFYLIDAEPARAAGLTADNWFTGSAGLDGSHILEFGEYFLGTTMGTAGHYRGRFGRHFPRNRGLVDDTMRGVIFDGYYTPLMWETPAGSGELTWLDREGEFYIGITIFRQSSTAALPGAPIGQSHMWFWEQNILVPFSVDNSAPEFAALSINGEDVNLTQAAPALQLEAPVDNDTSVEIAGNIFDLWSANAIAAGTTFDVWLDPDDASSKLVLWALAGDDGPANRPIKVEVDNNGYFEARLPNVLGRGEVDIRFWLFDGYAPVPLVNQVPLGVGNPNSTAAPNSANAYWNQPAVARIISADPDSSLPRGFMPVSEGTAALLRNDVIFGRAHSSNPAVYGLAAGQFNQFVWSGLNLTELTVTVNSEPKPSAEFRLVAFNNGNENNFLLAQSGLIRIWTQLDGRNMFIPYAELEVTAVLPDGSCALEFVRINHPWDDQRYTNFFEVTKHASWQTITLTATFDGQSVVLELINNRFVGPPVDDDDNDTEYGQSAELELLDNQALEE